MGERGGAPLPTALKLVAGIRPDRVNTDEPQPQAGVPECPSRDRDVLDVWNYTMKQLTVMRTVTLADRDILHAYCEQVVMHRRALAIVRREGPIVENASGGLMRHPASTLVKETAAMMKSLGAMFGLTPSARTAIRVGDQKPAKERGAARLLTG